MSASITKWWLARTDASQIPSSPAMSPGVLESFPMVLMYGVAQGVFVSVDVLCPVFTVLTAVYQAFVEFGLDDEYAVFGYYYVVNLGGAA